ncbi:hypothetical protein LPB86_03375 [Pedobacter sp. MC2016-14]|uniref:hypothetical protein n=1 Tax=Pedobacter sp. MC2016-14 TaxID=2897327 RepID=UPI001E2A2752|nr:hypothetical protein [Pedobacter sp. MC2016-14]MCD0487253.1 hypothetical protein [Pedobacter sp. MC2016-14]
MRLYFLAFFSILSFNALAQEKPVLGFVIDKVSKQRLAKVYIYNSRNDEGLYNTTKGEFKTEALVGDTLFAALQGYALDTVIFKGQTAIYFQLRPLSIRLREVAILGRMITPEEQKDKLQKEYKYALDRGSSRDLLTIGSAGAGLGIDAIYNLLSRKGKNARHLQEILERDYRESIIDYRFRKDYIKHVIPIGKEEITDFMQQYRPTYDFVLSASEYAFIVFLKNNYAAYKRNPKAFRLPPLPKVTIEKF